MVNFHLRDAEAKDAGAIIKLIKALAEYERNPLAVEANESLIEENLFKHQYANAILACDNSTGEAVAMALYFFNFSTWTGKPGIYLEDLFCLEERRGEGIGKALFRRLGEVAIEKKCARMDWVVLKWNEPSINFYTAIGATAMSEWEGMRLEGNALENLSKLK